jgi:branched-chain amino acid transport system permease protein
MTQVMINALTLGSIYLLFALGMSLTWGSIGILNFAHGAIFMFSAYITHVVLEQFNLPLVPTLVIGVVAGAVMSLLVQVLAFQPIINRNKDPQHAELQILIAGIGIAGVPLALAQKGTNSNPFGLDRTTFRVVTYIWAGVRISNIQIIIIVVGLSLGLGMTFWLRRSGTGLALRGIGVDAEVASLMGVNRNLLSLGTMTFAGGLAGLAGTMLTLYLGALAPESGDTFMLKAFAAIILGGVGSMLGAMIGSYIIAVTETLMLTYTSGTWVEAVSFAVIFLVLLVRPQGVLGRKVVRRT